MHVESVPAHPQFNSRTTWFAAAAVVLILGALAVFLLGCNQVYGIRQTKLLEPNYYTCQVKCTAGFGTGARVQTTTNGPISASPGGAFIVQDYPSLKPGTIVEGPGSPQGSNEIWWRVQFDDNVLGWAPETRLEVIGGTGAIVAEKDLDVCVPVGTTQVVKHCAELVVDAFKEIHGAELPPGTGCIGTAIPESDPGPKKEDASCHAPCPDPAVPCVRMGWDPDPPVPDPLSVAVFGTMTTCEVAGTAALVVDGHVAKPDPTPARGVVRILGRPCPGGTCLIGVGFALTGDDIHFDSGSMFASDPAFGDLNVRGVTEPAAITVGPLLGCTNCSFGGLGPDTILTTVEGKRLGVISGVLHPPRVLTFKNGQAVAILVDWAAKTCRLAGDLGGSVHDEDSGETLPVSADVVLDGVLVNQPPRPSASATQKTVECTVPGATPVTLDGSASTDPDSNISFYTWRQGSEDGPHLAAPSLSPVVTTTQALGQATYDLRVVDKAFSADHTPVTVSIVDTTAPVISCNAPATITPSDVPEKRNQGISFKATATDSCSGVSQVKVTNFSCTKPASCRVALQGDTITILDSGGVGDVITWTVSATDATGNAAQKTCELNVIKK